MQAVSLQACGIASRPHRKTEVDLCWIANQLGLLHRPRRTIIDKLRLLAETSGFPLPKTPRIVKGVRQTGAASIDAFSIWDRDAVELWIDNDRPPAESAALTVQRRNNVRLEMGKRALLLVSSNG